ncbi:MAG TPA: redoxin domain-containing protein [Longimicrobium sp.]
MGLKVGDRAPDVTLPSHEGEQTQLSSLWQDGPVALLFFPLAFSSTCTEELCTVRDDIGAYTGVNGRVAAISVDSPYVLKRYREDIGADFPFLSDFNREASQAFDVLRTAPVGPGLLNASDRAAFVVDRDGTVKYAWHETRPWLLPPFDEIKSALASA